MDNTIMKHLAADFERETGVNLLNDEQAVQRLKEAAEKAKIELSTTLTSDINLPFITATAEGPKHLTATLTRAKLEELVDPIIKKCANPMEQAIKDAKMSKTDINKIILVGGPTRMPIVQKFVEKFIGKPAESGIDPMECVAMGAAIQGGVMAGEIEKYRPIRCHTSFVGYRNPWWSIHSAYRKKHSYQPKRVRYLQLQQTVNHLWIFTYSKVKDQWQLIILH